MSGATDNVLAVAGRDVQLLPLTLGHWKRFGPAMRAMADGAFPTQDEMSDHMVDVIHASASRADPTLTRAEVEDTIDWLQAGQIYGQVLALSMPAASGEMTGASQPGASTGTLPSPASA